VSKDDLLAFMRRHLLAVQSSVSPDGAPQSAVIGYVVDDRLALFFDTKTDARKARNLRADPRIALVIGWDLDEACTLQIEGVADEPTGGDLARFKTIYFERFPDGVEREAWPDIAYFRVRPTWARFSDFRTPEPTIVELTLGDPVESSRWR
jgi:general stress protein 26